MKERLRIQGLRKRWILNSVGPVILILVLAAILASATVANNYYGSARSTLEAKAKAGADYFNSYSMSSYSEYYRNASLYAASFDSTRIELQFLNLYGRVDNSTQGVAAGTAPQTPELARALESGSIEVFSGKDPVTGESVMARHYTPEVQRLHGGLYALRHRHPADRPSDPSDHPHHQRHHRRGHLSGADLQSAVHQQRGGPGG